MRKIFYHIIICLSAVTLLVGCSKDDPDTSFSVFDRVEEPKNEFDKWLEKNYTDVYNIDYKYRMDDKEIDFTKNLVPSTLENSMKMASIIQHAWLDSYVEVAGVDFMRQHAPAILQVIGSASWNTDGTITLGTAEGGLKITIYMTNWLNEQDVVQMNEYFFNTMHHEFTHILHQDINYPQDFNLISGGDYSPSGWHNRTSINEYAPLGFVSAYAGSMSSEDVVEVTCRYLTYTDKQWSDLYAAAGEVGGKKLDQKIQIMKDYMMSKWNIDMDQLRNVVNRRMDEVTKLELIMPEWKQLLSNTPLTKAVSFEAMRAEYMANKANIYRQFETNADECQVHNASMLNLFEEKK
ncbi:MAG: zinc-binding metallopeptidase [Fermentimonas sp.]